MLLFLVVFVCCSLLFDDCRSCSLLVGCCGCLVLFGCDVLVYGLFVVVVDVCCRLNGW